MNSKLNPVKSALISVFNKEGLEPIIRTLNKEGVKLFSTGGTQKFIENLGISSTPIESVTEFPSILDGRVKTLHPKVFGGILWRRSMQEDAQTVSSMEIPSLDMVVVDLYPFEETMNSGAEEREIIEKIDIGGISLIRAGAKNFNDVWVVSSMAEYPELINILGEQEAQSSLKQRKEFAGRAFDVSANYDSLISDWFQNKEKPFSEINGKRKELRYGENPHQKAWFIGDLDSLFTQHSGKDLSYNNLLDIDAAMAYCAEGKNSTVAIIKHNNACGFASTKTLEESWDKALSSDPVSAFGSVIACNVNIDGATAKKISSLFFEVIIAPGFSDDAMRILKSKKNRIILESQSAIFPETIVRSSLNGLLLQTRDNHRDSIEDLKVVTKRSPTEKEIDDLILASAICKHTKSNTIVLAKDQQLISSGTGQTSRVDALNQAIHKAKSFGMKLEGAVMASDAFFPFPDCVELANAQGIKAVIQPGGSIKDNLSIDFCDNNEITMVTTGIRHFKH
ncbi:MAG: bifunctional phosphoribosylaminoimidazolecarboxamide formyltransferase/IMP cyclohydrolase [Schleiferiaceae bacterium]|nr:bifunctional phosphoribosylaminoimidazolecarboxamide formyltransferase/IMP cyclohydrolase [Schleiferiaceae bacterium]